MRQGSLRSRPDVLEGTPLWPSGFGAWIRIGIVYARTSRRMTAMLRPNQLTIAQFDVLAHLYAEDGISQQALAERLVVTKGNVTGLINRLAARKLVMRQHDPHDRRANRVVLTSRGKELAHEMLLLQAELVREMMDRLTLRERQTLSKLLGRLASHFDS